MEIERVEMSRKSGESNCKREREREREREKEKEREREPDCSFLKDLSNFHFPSTASNRGKVCLAEAPFLFPNALFHL